MDLKEIGWEGVDWIQQAQDGCHWRGHIYLRIPQTAENFSIA